VRGWARLLPLLAILGCSSLEEGEGGVVGLEILAPPERNLEVGEQVQLSARALDADGQTVEAPIEWRVSTGIMAIDDAGLATAIAPGSGGVQAVVGSLASAQLTFNVTARADTVIIVGDSVLVVPIATEPVPPATMSVRLESFSPAAPVTGQGVIFTITQPVLGTTPVVQLAGGVQTATVNTSATDGVATTTLSLVAGQVPPDTAIVEIRAARRSGAPVPGSGQHFIILFQ
jgi:hypothetical protein